MKRAFATIFAALLFLAVPQAFAQDPQQQPDLDEIINSQVENLAKLYHLDDVQIFYVDSILQNNMRGMMDEIEQTRRTGASNATTFEAVSDKWLSATDEAFERVFTEDQWKKYMKSSFGKEKKKRDKRIAEREAARVKE
ncbi:MAG: hypothetical protein K6G79_03840 [Bacteroidales bacterium]|nr:hypothetical protein [Bacteroidales bacterium]